MRVAILDLEKDPWVFKFSNLNLQNQKMYNLKYVENIFQINESKQF